jgi:plastocyanin
VSVATLFYVCGIALAVSAVTVSVFGLKVRDFPGKAAPLVALWFIALIGCTTTFGVLHAQDESEARANELVPAGEEVEKAEADSLEAGEEAEAEEGEAEAEEGEAEAEEGEAEAEAEGQTAAPAPAEGGEKAKPEGGGATTLKLAAEPSEIAFDTTSLSAKAGNVTIDFTNPSPLEHNVAIEKEGKKLAQSETIASGKTSVSVDLEPGTYTFLCTIPGHAEAGMEGTLTVK